MERITVIIDFKEQFIAQSINNDLTLGLCAYDNNLEIVKHKYKQLVEGKVNELTALQFYEPIEYLLAFKLVESAKLEQKRKKKVSVEDY